MANMPPAFVIYITLIPHNGPELVMLVGIVGPGRSKLAGYLLLPILLEEGQINPYRKILNPNIHKSPNDISGVAD